MTKRWNNESTGLPNSVYLGFKDRRRHAGGSLADEEAFDILRKASCWLRMNYGETNKAHSGVGDQLLRLQAGNQELSTLGQFKANRTDWKEYEEECG
jgi:hypothetical protein